MQREMQSARFAVPSQNLFVELKRSRQESFPFTDHLLYESTQIVESCRLQSAARLGSKMR